MISTSIAARSLIDIERFYTYTSIEAIENDREAYDQTLEELRSLKRQLGVTNVYALKQIDGSFFFVFDTDNYSDTIFDEYARFPVHERAFLGEESAGIMNLVDQYGSFNTGAVPIWRNGQVIGIVSTDIVDIYMYKKAPEQRTETQSLWFYRLF